MLLGCRFSRAFHQASMLAATIATAPQCYMKLDMATLQNLPEDAKRLICEALYHESIELVRSLWQVSKAWRAVAEPFVYRGLALVVVSKEAIKEDAKKLMENEFARKYLEHARYVYLTTKILQWIAKGDKADAITTNFGPLPPDFSLHEPITPVFNDIFTTDREEERGIHISDPEEDREVLRQTWEPIITLIAQFKNLSDIVIQLQTRMPPDLVATVAEHYPKCRVHLRDFRYKSLHNNVTDPDERSLAISTNLHALSIMYMYRDTDGVEDHNGAAALHTVALAPNIKHVRMLGCSPAVSIKLYQAKERPLKPWKGFIPPIDESRSQNRAKAKLETLGFTGHNDELTLQRLARWEAVADFSSLEVLACSIGSPSVLHHLSISGTFPSITSLTMSLQPRADSDDFSRWYPTVENLFAVLNPLKILNLFGTLHSQLLVIIADRHGSTLQGLSLIPYADLYIMPKPMRITAKDIGVLAAGCPRLTRMLLLLKRSMGDQTETRCYEAIGAFKNLERLQLRLDCTDTSEWEQRPETWFDAYDIDTQTHEGSMPESYNGYMKYLKRAIINSALDETLARQIWSVVNCTRNKSSLKSMELKTFGGSMLDNSPSGGLTEIVSHVSRAYHVSRIENGNDDVNIVELSKEGREFRDKRSRESYQRSKEKGDNQREERGASLVFRHLWPHREDEDWRDVWRSWPLET
ncbi:hypothetical protein N0V90_006398 [Kalmusia sp. IMI 367209]|nr:hypothetical protein N0V90_006398 [Kalmusia sp. IMI 367209]